MQQHILALRDEALLASKGAGDLASLEVLETRYLGRKSELTTVLKSLKDLSPEERRTVGPLAQEAKRAIETAFAETRERLQEGAIDWEAERLDVTLPPAAALRHRDVPPQVYLKSGHLHLLTQVAREIEDIFLRLGFEVVDGPELETESYNFEALNMGPDHPARDMQDTFWVKTPEGRPRYLPRTHTSAVQVRYMERHQPPFRIISPGRIFRNEATDATHEHTFHQFESLMVGEDVHVGHFKAVAEAFFAAFFGKETTIRLRPSYFPYTEPSFEFDMRCTLCGGAGADCSVCRGAGWIEIGGAGMVHQGVFTAAGYARDAWQGFAWGFGLERLAMLKYGVPDIRLFHGGELSFLERF